MQEKKNKYFLLSFIKDRKTIGSVHPSSRALARKMLSDIDFNKVNTILEFGPGTGVFTRIIVDKITDKTNFYIFELYTPFYEDLKEEFGDYPNVFIFNEKAQDAIKHLQEDSVDHIISSLPLTNMSKYTTIRIMETARTLLKPEGLFTQYQYTLTAKRLLKKIFNKIHLEFTFNNLPPAFIYKCKKEKSVQKK